MERFDYIVVGAGSAGCVLAARLSEDRTARVLLLEAGPRDRHLAVHVPAAFPRLFGSRLDWNLYTAPQPAIGGRRVYWPRGRMLGGSSSMNAMMWVRGFAADYDAWAAACGPQWSYDAVLGEFGRIEATEGAAADDGRFGSTGPLPVRELAEPNPLTRAWLSSAAAAGIGANRSRNAGEEAGVGTAMVTQRAGRRVSAADAYLRPARGRPNLVVRTGAEVDRLVLTDRRASAVTWHGENGSGSASAAREIVLCAGTIGTPSLLMRSGIGPAPMLRAAGVEPVVDAAGIGQHLEDHLCAGFAVSVAGHKSLGGAAGARSVAAYLLARRGLLSSNICEGYGFVRSSPGLPLCDLELLFVPGLFIDEGRTIDKRHGVTLAAVLLQPASRGEIRLGRGGGAPELVIDPAYLSDERGDDARVLGAGVAMCLEIARRPPLSEITGALVQPPPGSDDEIVDQAVHGLAQTLYHPVGTCAMGRADSAPVDPELRLRGVSNLRVADASVIPRIIRGHTNAPTMVIAERAARLLGRGAGR